jgi:hypothetical protein
VHRWNKAQQDALLPWVENGTIIMIGATTENPYFEVNRALVSRSRIFQLKPLDRGDLYASPAGPRRPGAGLRRSWTCRSTTAPWTTWWTWPTATRASSTRWSWPWRPPRALPDAAGDTSGTLEVAEESIQRRAVLYDKEGDYHFDTISAFIKSCAGLGPGRGAVLAGQDGLCRRGPALHLPPAADLRRRGRGLADPQALGVVVAAAPGLRPRRPAGGALPPGPGHAVPGHAPKSNSTMGFFDALAAVEKERERGGAHPPADASRDKEGFGHGEGYLYPHAYRDHWVAQQYLPRGLQGKVFYQPLTLRQQASRLSELERPIVLEAAPAALLAALSSDERTRPLRFDRALGRSLLSQIEDPSAWLRGLAALLAADGLILVSESDASRGQRLSALLDWTGAEALGREATAAEEPLYRVDASSTTWTAERLRDVAGAAGLGAVDTRVHAVVADQRITPAMLERWFGTSEAPGPYRAALRSRLEDDVVEALARRYHAQLAGRAVPWRSTFVVLRAAPS